jgi:hypothetical protein
MSHLRVVENLLERFSIEERLRDLEVELLRELLRDLEVRLVDLRESRIDDLLVELVLFLETEHLRRLLRQHVDDSVEDRVVQIRVVDRDRLDLLVETLRELDGGHERPERLRAAVDADENRVAALGRLRVRNPLDDQDVLVRVPRHPLTDRAELTVPAPPHPQDAHDDQIVVRADDVLEDLGAVLPVHHPRHEVELGLAALRFHRAQVAFRDQLEAHGDEAVVDLPLPLELRLLDVLVRERELHLLEAVVVHPGGVDVASDHLRFELLPELDRHRDRLVGMVRVVDGNVDGLIHQSLLGQPVTSRNGNQERRLAIAEKAVKLPRPSARIPG